MSSSLERAFTTLRLQLAPDLPEPVAEYQFAPPRRWRFDFCWLDVRVAVELEGGTRNNGRHNRHAGYTADCHKYNAAIIGGWRVLRFTSEMLLDDPATCFDVIRLALDIEDTNGA